MKTLLNQIALLGVVIIGFSASYVSQAALPCAYWCEASCAPKSLQFYCCSFKPSLIGPDIDAFLDPPCPDLCRNRTNNAPSYQRNCLQEREELKASETFKLCRNFKDCDANKHDLCCKDNCLPGRQKMCIKL